MDPETPASMSATNLLQEISEYNQIPSRFFPNFDLKQVLAQISDFRIVKQNSRRQVVYLQTPAAGYYLKCFTLMRTKDRLRHFLLPRRRWAEWRNLHRLFNAGIPAARPVMKGWQRGLPPKSFFLITEKIDGRPLKYDLAASAKKLGRFIARLHARGVYHLDLNQKNIILQPDGELCLIDVQEVYFLPVLPRRWQIHNLGKLFFHIRKNTESARWGEDFLQGYNRRGKKPITVSEIFNAADGYEQSRLRSRSKRCCRNSRDFEIVKSHDLIGFKRRDFAWDAAKLQEALRKAVIVKTERVFCFQSICIKRHRRKLLHPDRCLNSWKMSQALAVRGISAPRALGYFKMDGDRLFVSEFLTNSTPLNDYLSSLSNPEQKRLALKNLAGWLKKIHSHNIWQRDFKSRNVLCRKGEYFLLDLEGVRIRRLTARKRTTNLAQLNASVSHEITLKDRLRFFHFYTAAEKLSRHQRRAIYEKVWKISKTKSTKNYNLDLDALRKSLNPRRPG